MLCVVRSADGRWLAGRRAAWVATWAGRWALGAGGAVEVGENPALTLPRELEEEWSVVPGAARRRGARLPPNRMAMLIGQAWLVDGAAVSRDHEHDAHAWWPADPDALAGGGRPHAAPDGHAARGAGVSFRTLKYLSFAHSAVYLSLLTVWLSPGLARAEIVLGWCHGWAGS